MSQCKLVCFTIRGHRQPAVIPKSGEAFWCGYQHFDVVISIISTIELPISVSLLNHNHPILCYRFHPAQCLCSLSNLSAMKILRRCWHFTIHQQHQQYLITSSSHRPLLCTIFCPIDLWWPAHVNSTTILSLCALGLLCPVRLLWPQAGPKISAFGWVCLAHRHYDTIWDMYRFASSTGITQYANIWLKHYSIKTKHKHIVPLPIPTLPSEPIPLPPPVKHPHILLLTALPPPTLPLEPIPLPTVKHLCILLSPALPSPSFPCKTHPRCTTKIVFNLRLCDKIFDCCPPPRFNSRNHCCTAPSSSFKFFKPSKC